MVERSVNSDIYLSIPLSSIPSSEGSIIGAVEFGSCFIFGETRPDFFSRCQPCRRIATRAIFSVLTKLKTRRREFRLRPKDVFALRSAFGLRRRVLSVQRGSFLSHRPDVPGQCALSASRSFFSFSLLRPPSRNFDDEFRSREILFHTALRERYKSLLFGNASKKKKRADILRAKNRSHKDFTVFNSRQLNVSAE